MKGLSKFCCCVLVLYLLGFPGRSAAVPEETLKPASASNAASSGRPSILVQSDSFDFGEVLETEPISHDFIVKNESRTELHIRDVSPSWGCTIARFDRAIPAGGEGKVTLKLDLRGFQGFVKKTAAISSDDPAKPRIIVTVQGKVKPLIEVRPEKTVFFQGMADRLDDKSIELFSSLRTFHIKKLKDNLDGKATYRLETLEDGKHYRLAISNRMKQGNYRGAITLHTDLADKPEVTIWVSGFIEGEIAVRPNTLVLGQLAAEQPVLTGKVLVTSNRKTGFKITRCSHDDKIITVTQSPLPGQSGFSLEISPNMESVSPGDRVQTVVTIETDVSGGKHEIQVQVMNLAGTSGKWNIRK